MKRASVDRSVREVIARYLVMAVALFVLIAAVLFFDALCRGPYTQWYNHRLLEAAKELIGQPQGRVEQVLGPAHYQYESLSGSYTYGYCPLWWIHLNTFEVHCFEGRVATRECFEM